MRVTHEVQVDATVLREVREDIAQLERFLAYASTDYAPEWNRVRKTLRTLDKILEN